MLGVVHEGVDAAFGIEERPRVRVLSKTRVDSVRV